jgi:hypothetical protein
VRPVVVRARTLAPVVLALALTSTACGPKPSLQVGLKNYNTDIVFGGKKKVAPLPPPPPAAEITPLFPGLIQPPPLPRIVVNAPVVTTTTALPPKQVECPQANLLAVPPPATSMILEAPLPGLYAYRMQERTDPKEKVRAIPGGQVRKVFGVGKNTVGDTTYSVDIASPDGSHTQNFYEIRNVASDPTASGLYLRSVLHTWPNNTRQEYFGPVGDGLRMFAMPADVGVTWNSVASDPLHTTSMSLSGAIKERRRVDACGTVVEGWLTVSDITVSTSNPDGPGLKVFTIHAEYVVVPQLGGLIANDRTETVDGATDYLVESTLSSLVPKPLPPGP